MTGLSLSLLVVLLQYLLLTPDVETPFEKMLEDPASRVAVALFGITLGPMVEELIFRGFLQPVLVGVMGVFPGILTTSILFGALHLTQNAYIWQSGALIMLVGLRLRHGTPRVRIQPELPPSFISHHNSLPFIALVVDGSPLTRK